MIKTDVLIIGAGPVGLFSIFECGMMSIKCHVIDSLKFVGGQCQALYPQKPIYDIPGFPKILAQDLIKNLKEQAAPFKPQYHLDQTVTNIKKKENIFIVETSKNTIIEAKVILITAGSGAFLPNRPPLNNIQNFEGHSVFYSLQNDQITKNKNVIIAGGGDSAVDWAIHLCNIAKSVTMIHRRNKFRAAPESIKQLEELKKQGKIILKSPYQVTKITGQDNKISQVEITSFEGTKEQQPADIFLPFFGLKMNLGPIKNWGINIQEESIIINPQNGQTNIKGIYAAGDICNYPNKVKLILTGFAEATQAIYNMRSIVFPNKVWHFEHSTSKGIKGFNVA